MLIGEIREKKPDFRGRHADLTDNPGTYVTPMTKHTVQHVNIVGDCLILLVASAVATKAPGVPGAWH